MLSTFSVMLTVDSFCLFEIMLHTIAIEKTFLSVDVEYLCTYLYLDGTVFYKILNRQKNFTSYSCARWVKFFEKHTNAMLFFSHCCKMLFVKCEKQTINNSCLSSRLAYGRNDILYQSENMTNPQHLLVEHSAFLEFILVYCFYIFWLYRICMVARTHQIFIRLLGQTNQNWPD